jgi:hypothetical protein
MSQSRESKNKALVLKAFYREDPPAVSGPIVSDCTIVGSYHDKPYCFGNSYRGYTSRTAPTNLGGGAY